MALRRRADLSARDGVDLGRMAREGAGSLVYTLAVIVSVAIVLTLSVKFSRSWDMSAQGTNSLSPQTVEALGKLSEGVQVKALYTAKHPDREPYWELLQRYRQASPKVSVEFIDPIARPGAVRDLGLSIADESTRRDGATAVLRGSRKIVFRGTAEEDVTNAILEAGSDRKRVIGFLRGYGEADPDSGADAGLKKAAEALRAEYYETKDVFLESGIPADLTVLVVAGPHAAIPEADLGKVEAWLESGGRLLALLDPGDLSGIERVVSRWGVAADGGQVVDPRENFNGRPEFLRVTDFSGHPVVRGFGKTLPAALPVAVGVRHFEPGDPEVYHDRLFRSSRFSESLDAEGKRKGGPFDLGVASWKRVRSGRAEEGETRVVVIGNAAFAMNAYLPMAANRNLFLNCVGWLSRAEGLVSIRRQPLAGQTPALGPLGIKGLYLAVFTAPLLVIAAGIVVFLRRRGL